MAQVLLEFLEGFLTLVRLNEGLLRCLEEGQAFVRYFRDEPVEYCYSSCEVLDFFHGFG